ncbi:MAG: tyrosine-type recombinase/integrase [Myxococcota bacterium]
MSAVLPFVPKLPAGAGVPTGLALPELWRQWWPTTGQRMAKNTQKVYRRTEALSHSLPSHPSVLDVAHWLAALGRMGHGAGTAELRRQVLAALYSWGMSAGLVSANPAALCKGILHRPPRADIHPGVRELLDAWPALLSACATEREAGFLGVLRFAGLREEEALAMRARDVLQAQEPWGLSVMYQRPHVNDLVRVAECKGRRGRDLEVRPELRALLAPVLALPPAVLRFGTRSAERVKREVAWLFPFREGELRKFAARLREVAPEALLPRRLWHHFRRAFAYELRAAGVAIEDIRDLLGHESSLTTEGYCGRVLGRRVRRGIFNPLLGGKGHPTTEAASIRVGSSNPDRNVPSARGESENE